MTWGSSTPPDLERELRRRLDARPPKDDWVECPGCDGYLAIPHRGAYVGTLSWWTKAERRRTCPMQTRLHFRPVHERSIRERGKLAW